MSSKITTDHAVDDPVELNARWRFDAPDRRFLDDQIRGCQQLLVSCLVDGITATYALVDASSAALAVGDVVCLAGSTTGEPTVTKAVDAALTAALSPCGVVLVAAPPGAQVLFAIGGVVPSTTTGLAAASGAVRVNGTTARCEFVSSFTAGDYVLGTCDAQGYLNLTPSYAYPSGGGGGGSSAGTSGQVQTSDGAGGFTAPTNVLAGANFCSVGGTPATTGFYRLGIGGTARVRDAGNTADLSIFESAAGNILYIGTDSAFTGANQFTTVGMYSTAGGFVYLGNGAFTRLRCDTSGVTIYQNGDPLIFGNSGTALSGMIRLPNAVSALVARNAANSADVPLVQTDGSDYVYLGNQTGRYVAVSSASDDCIMSNTAYGIWLRSNAGNTTIGNTNILSNQFTVKSAGFHYLTVGSTDELTVGASAILVGPVPITGNSGNSSPYSVHGGFSFVMAIASGSYTVTAAQYQYDHCEFTTGSLTGSFTTVWPAPASLAVGYYKTITNATTQTMTISTGSGTTKTLATNLTARFWFDSAGVQFASSTFTR